MVAESFEKTLLSHYEGLFNFVRRFTQYSDAQDIAQETIIKALNSQESFDQKRASLRTWLYTIAKNHFLSDKRKIKRRNEISFSHLVESNNNPHSQVLIKYPSSETEIDEKPDYSDLIRFIAELPKKQSEIVIRYYFLGQNYKVISKDCNLSHSDIKSRMHRAKKGLELRLAC